MNREQKGQVTAAVVERLERADAVVAADFRGLTVAELADLRGRLRDAEAEMTVVKNTLSRRAVNETGRLALLPYLEGPTGLVWINGDPARAAKALNDFAKEHKEVFSIRGGILGAEDLPTANIVRLASLPSREVLLARLAGGIAAPLSGLAGTLNSLISTLARTLEAVKGSGALAPGEAAPQPAAEEAPAAVVAAPETEEPSVEDAPAPEGEAPVATEDTEAPAAVTETPDAEAPSVDDAPAPEGDAPAGAEEASAAETVAVVEADAPASEPAAVVDDAPSDEVGDLFPDGLEHDPTDTSDTETPS